MVARMRCRFSGRADRGAALFAVGEGEFPWNAVNFAISSASAWPAGVRPLRARRPGVCWCRRVARCIKAAAEATAPFTEARALSVHPTTHQRG